MKLLDPDRLGEFLARDYAGEERTSGRLVGVDRKVDSGYYDILRFFGDRPLDPSAIKLRYLSEPFQLRDELVARYAVEIAAKLRADRRLYDGPPVTRLEQIDLRSDPPTATLQSASYAEQAGSSFAMDHPHPLFEQYGGTLRDYYIKVYGPLRFTHNPLCVCLGVCGQLIIRDGENLSMLIVHRSAKLASLENSIGPSVAGSVDYVESLATLDDLMRVSFRSEITEEIGLRDSEYQLIPLTYAREVLRGDRPQLFVLMITDLPIGEVTDRIEHAGKHGEFDSYEFLPLIHGRLTDHQIAALNFEARMSYYLAEEYLHLNVL